MSASSQQLSSVHTEIGNRLSHQERTLDKHYELLIENKLLLSKQTTLFENIQAEIAGQREDIAGLLKAVSASLDTTYETLKQITRINFGDGGTESEESSTDLSETEDELEEEEEIEVENTEQEDLAVKTEDLTIKVPNDSTDAENGESKLKNTLASENVTDTASAPEKEEEEEPQKEKTEL